MRRSEPLFRPIDRGGDQMARRDVVVVGASAGGVEALRVLVSLLPADLPAAVLIVLHVPRSGPSALPAILGRVSTLPVRSAVDGEPLRHGRIYVAPVDRHLLVIDSHVRLSRGPSENGHRPAIDPLFRSVARALGPRAVGVVLSGSRDDGAAGLAAIAGGGGTTIVQDPHDATFSSMPRAALERVVADHVVPVAEIGALIGRISRLPASEIARETDPELAVEVALSDLAVVPAEKLPGSPVGFGCPACGGSLFVIKSGPIPRYRCRVGHAWSPESLLEEQTAALEGALWMALRALDEKAVLGRQMAASAGERLGSTAYARLEVLAEDADNASKIIRGLMDRLGTSAEGPTVDSAQERGA
jgi:two-component system, chemotaxis family, protein-glutamate methylesterase/glutaminase